MDTTSSLVIDGKVVQATGGAVYDNVNPATEEVVGTAADGSVADADAAVAAARAAFDSSAWASDPALRSRCLVQLRDGLRAHAEELREVLIAEAGVPVSVTQFVQLDPPIEDLTYVAELAESYAYEESLPDRVTLMGPARRLVRREPTGVVAAITPWNYPMLLQLAKVAPALGAGCTVVLKPAPDTPWTGSIMGRIAAEETDIPAGVLNVVTSSDHGVGAHLTSHPDVDMVTFTGSTATGRRVMASASETIKRVFLELGGKSAAIILDDADVAANLSFIAGQVCMHAGQGCALTTRILVARSRYDEVVEAAAEVAATYPWGDPLDPANMMGPVINRTQFERVLGYLDLGRSEARLVAGGSRSAAHDRGFFIEPTVFADVDPGARIAREEIFGPVMCIVPFDDDDDAVRIANDSIYGLSGSVTSADPERALAIARRLRTGTVGVNGAVWLAPDSPFGGYKQSGIGRENGIQGFEEYLETKAIAIPA